MCWPSGLTPVWPQSVGCGFLVFKQFMTSIHGRIVNYHICIRFLVSISDSLGILPLVIFDFASHIKNGVANRSISGYHPISIFPPPHTLPVVKSHQTPTCNRSSCAGSLSPHSSPRIPVNVTALFHSLWSPHLLLYQHIICLRRCWFSDLPKWLPIGIHQMSTFLASATVGIKRFAHLLNMWTNHHFKLTACV